MILTHICSVDDLIQSSWDLETVSGYCRSCEFYQRNFSCPPQQFDILQYLKPFNRVLLVAHELALDPARPMSLAEHFYSRKQCIDQRLMQLEKQYPQNLVLLPGQCQNCQPSCGTSGLAGCAQPELKRYSLESLGFNVATLLNTYFDKELTFTEDRVILVYAILLRDTPDSDTIEQWKGYLRGCQTHHQ